MARQQTVSVENNFIGGLKTENNPLNFPENACTDTDNCIFGITGNVTRRPGINFETNFVRTTRAIAGKALSSFKWNNAGGDGLTQIVVQQVGAFLYFYNSTAATTANPLSAVILGSTINLTSYQTGGVVDTVECQYASGNGYLFVFNPVTDTLCLTYNAGVITAQVVTIKIRDFSGMPDGNSTNVRPPSLSNEHKYNLSNQGWTSAQGWATNCSTSLSGAVGSKVFTVLAGLPVVLGQQVIVIDPAATLSGTVTAYAGTSLTVNCYSTTNSAAVLGSSAPGFYTISSQNTSLIDNWFTAEGNYPSNSDVWWTFKDNTNVFNPATTVPNVTLGVGFAAKGHFVLEACNQQRSSAASIPSLTAVSTGARARTGTWFQGRVWFAGIDATQQATGDMPTYSWSENIYFSQVAEDSSQFGLCYQNNDPTSESFFDLLPTDGGTIRIQDSGSVYKLFPVQNGLLVFAANGIWFITGSQGIGFSANDYTVTKISAVTSLSGTSFVNVLGWPVFWNEEGIYAVSPSEKGGGLTVDNLCLGTVLSFYADIPSISKKYVRGDYNPLDFVITWIFRDTNESDVTSRYQYNRALNFNTSSKAFYPWTFSSGPKIHDVKYVSSPGGTGAPQPAFKYFTSTSDNTKTTFSELNDTSSWLDFNNFAETPTNYVSDFETGYKIHGQAQRKWQPSYIYMFSTAEVPTAYKIQGIWDFARSDITGRFSSIQLIENSTPNFGVLFRRHRLRGNGLSLQMKITSVDGKPFSFIGWSIAESSNSGV